MNRNPPRIVRIGLLLALAPLIPALVTGCAATEDPPPVDPSASVLGAPYHPVKTYEVAAPPTLHYWAPSGTAAINAQLMNRMR